MEEEKITKQIFEAEGEAKLRKLKQKMKTTQENIEISEELMDTTPYEAERTKLIKRNKNRHHAIGSMKKEIRDIEQRLEND